MKKLRSFTLLAVVGFILLRFYPMILLGKTSVFGDNYSLMVPGKIFIAQNFLDGVIPLWNPYIFSGISLIGDVNQSMFYFSTLFFVLFTPTLATNLTVIVHVLLVGMGTYHLIKRLTNHSIYALLGGILMGLSTQVSGSINNLSTLQSVTWFPWLALMGLKLGKDTKYVLVFGLLVLIQFLAGYPQHVIYGIGFAVLLSGFYQWEKVSFWLWLKKWFLATVFSLLLSAAVWFPFVEMLGDSTRMTQSLDQAQMGSLKPGMMVKIFFPYFFDKQSEGIKWGPSWSGQPNVFFYVGNFALLLLVSVLLDKKQRKKEDWFYFIFVVSTVLFSLGEFLPGFELIQRLVPLFKFGRYPSMVLILTNLGLIIWLASVMTRVKLKPAMIKITSFIWLLWVVLGLILLYLVRHDFAMWWTELDQLIGNRLSQSTFHTLARDQAIVEMIASNLITAGFLALLSLLAYIKKQKSLVIIFIGLDVLVHTQGMFYFAPKQIYDYQDMTVFKDQLKNFQYRILTRDSNSPYTDYGTYWQAMAVREPFGDSFIDDQELQSYSKLIHIRDSYTPNWNIVHRLPMVHGYATLLPKDYSAIWAQNDETRINFIDFVDPSNPKLQDWSVKYYLVDRLFEIKENIPFKLLAKQGQYELYELPGVKPRFRFSNGQPIEPEEFQETANRISLSFNNTAEQQTIIIANRFDRNWMASLNGQKINIENFQGMQLIRTVPGMNKLILEFVPVSFYLGLIISLVGLVGGVMWIVAQSRNPRHHHA